MAIEAPAYRLDNDRLDTLLRDRQVSLPQFAKKAGLSIRTMRRIRAGDNDVSLRVVGLMLDALPGVQFEYLFARQDVLADAS